MDPTAIVLERRDDAWRLTLSGDWSLASMSQIDGDLQTLSLPQSGALVCDWSRVEAIGIGPAWAVLAKLTATPSDALRVTHSGPPHTLEFLQKLHVERHSPHAAHEFSGFEDAVGELGRWTYVQGAGVRGLVEFFGRIVAVIGEAPGRPRALRPKSLLRHIYEIGVTAVPIVSLIAFLISVIVAYLGAQQLARFGATIFVVDLVTISVLREMGVMLTAIVVAGRSGSAFAAELGVMQLNEETDALRAMGMNPIEVLIVPRILALAIALPLLTIVADAMGLAGGCLLCLLQLHIPLPQFISRLHESLAPTTFWSGLVKAPVFAVLIGMMGAYRGMQVRESARELGRLTTVAVVQSIFMVILADAVFAVLFVQIDF